MYVWCLWNNKRCRNQIIGFGPALLVKSHYTPNGFDLYFSNQFKGYQFYLGLKRLRLSSFFTLYWSKTYMPPKGAHNGVWASRVPWKRCRDAATFSLLIGICQRSINTLHRITPPSCMLRHSAVCTIVSRFCFRRSFQRCLLLIMKWAPNSGRWRFPFPGLFSIIPRIM